MIARLATVIYWACLLFALTFSVAIYHGYVETVEEVISKTPCTLTPEDERAANEERYEDVSDAGLFCITGGGYLTETETKTVYGDAPLYWLFCFLIALVGYSIRYILTGIRNPLPWINNS